MVFEIIGAGSGFCEKLYDLTTGAVADNCPDAEVRKVTDWKQVIRHVPFTSVLKLDGRVIHRGKFLPSKDKLVGMIAARIHP